MAGTAVAPMPPAARAAIQARNTLGRAESSAANGNSGWFTGTGREGDDMHTHFYGNLKNKIVAIVLLALFGGGMAFLGSSNSLLAPAIEELFTEATDTQYGSASARFRYLTIFGVKNADKQLGSVLANDYGKMSTRFKNRLAKQGFSIEGVKGNQFIRYTNPKTGAVTDINDIAQFKNLYKSDVDLRQSYNLASRGRVATFFDNVADKVYNNLRQSRNIWAGHKQTGDAEADEASFRKTMMSKFGDADADMDIKNLQSDDEEGGTDTKHHSSSEADGTTPTDRSKTFLNGVVSKFAKATQAAETACTFLKIGSLISVTVAANEIYQSISYFMGLSENISKMKAGQGDASAINETLNLFSTSQTTQYDDLTSDKAIQKGTEAILSNSKIDNDNEGGDMITLVGSPLMSTGMQFVLGGAPASAANTNKFSVGRINNSIARILAATGLVATMNTSKNTACSIASAANALVSIAVSITPAGVVKTLGDAVFSFVLSVAVSITAQILVSLLVPVVAQFLFTNVFETATGIVAGEMFTRGAAAANTRVGRSGSGQSLTDESTATAYNHITQTQIALDAEVERQTHSPFDISNKNTFFGSIAYSLLPIITTTKLNSVASFVRTTVKSVSSIISPVSANGIGSTYMTTFNPNCEELEEIGAVGDLYCNPITVTDPDLIEMDPLDTDYQRIIKENTTPQEDGTYTIRENSELAYYISFCANRDSPFGTIDTSILAEFEFSTGKSWLDAIINNIPIIGDLVGLYDAAQDQIAEKWANGKACVANETENQDWKKYKYFQRYVEDMRLLEDMGAFNGSKNPVTSYMEQYREKHPLDTSTAGIIAHYTGMTKDDAELMLAFFEYYRLIDDYDPTLRIAIHQEATFNQTGTEIANNLAAKRLLFEEDNQSRQEFGMPTNKQYVAYYDIRNRSFAV